MPQLGQESFTRHCVGSEVQILSDELDPTVVRGMRTQDCSVIDGAELIEVVGDDVPSRSMMGLYEAVAPNSV